MSGAGGGGGGAGGGAHKSNVLVTAGVAAAALVFGFWKAKNARAPVRRQSTKDSAAGGGSKSAGEDRFENDDKSPESGLVPVVQKLPLAHVLQSSAHLDTAAQSGPDSYDHGTADADEDDVVDSTTSSSYQQYRWPRIHEDSPHRTFDERVATKCAVGQRVMVRRSKQQGSRGTVRFVGRMPSVRPGVWIGVELDADAGPGKNSGDARGRKVFECAPGQGMFCLEDAVEAADAPTDVYAAAARLAGRWVGECVSHGVLPTQSLEAAGLHGTHLCTPISDNNPGGSRDGQPGPVAGSFWFVFQGSGDDSGVDDGLSPHSVAGEWPTCRSFVDGRRCGTGEWSIALREHHFLQRLVVSCSPSTVEGTHSQPQSATASQADGTGSDEGTAGTHVPTRARSAFAVSFLDNNRIELRFGATPEAFEAGEGLVVLRLEHVPLAFPRGGFSSRERAVLCIDKLARFWKEQIEEIAEANHKIAVSNPSDQELRTLRRQQRRDILRETGRIYFRHGLEPFSVQYLTRLGLEDDKKIRLLLEDALQHWEVLDSELSD